MNGLRVYIEPLSGDSRVGNEVFYSRRSDGPYYRWSFEERLAEWHVLRMHACDLTRGDLELAPWKGVPSSLKVRLTEHYLE